MKKWYSCENEFIEMIKPLKQILQTSGIIGMFVSADMIWYL